VSEGSAIAPEARALLARSRRVFLLTLRADGSPTAHPMTGVFARDRLAFSTYRKAAKTRNALRDPRTCSLALEGYDGAGARAVVYRGPARALEGEQAAELFGGGAAAAGPVSGGVAGRATARLAEGKRVVLAVEPAEVELLRAPGD
jgi:hypothetical protein